MQAELNKHKGENAEMIKPSEFSKILMDMTNKRIPQMPIWRSQSSPKMEVDLLELVKLANDCREEAAKLCDFADYVDCLWENLPNGTEGVEKP